MTAHARLEGRIDIAECEILASFQRSGCQNRVETWLHLHTTLVDSLGCKICTSEDREMRRHWLTPVTPEQLDRDQRAFLAGELKEAEAVVHDLRNRLMALQTGKPL